MSKKFPKPWFRPARNVWYVTIDGVQHNLGSDEDAAFERYHRLMAERHSPGEVGRSGTDVGGQVDDFVETLAVKFVAWCQKHRSPATAVWYKERIESFLEHAGDIRVANLKPFHLEDWCDAHPKWSPGMRRGAIIAAQRCLNWAVKMGHLGHSPIAHCEKPQAGRRERLLTTDEYGKLISLVKDEPFRDLLTVSWEVGCRPQESLIVEARHVDLANQRWVFEKQLSKGKKQQRVVYLTDKAREICERLVAKHPQGPIFRNVDGKPWTPYAVNNRFCRLTKKLGFKCCLYLLRHAWMTRLLKQRVDPITVSTLAGHVDTSMLARIYQHLAQDADHLLSIAKKAGG